MQTGIVLQVNANPVINAVLGLGNLAETVTVQAAAPLVDVRTAGLRDVVEQERIVELPLQTRQVTDLIALAGAAVNTGRVSTLSSSNAVAISVAGGLRNGVEYSLDGAMHNSHARQHATCRSPSRMRCRSSASPPAACPRRTGRTRGRRSTR